MSGAHSEGVRFVQSTSVRRDGSRFVETVRIGLVVIDQEQFEQQCS